MSRADVVTLLYIVGFALFIVGLRMVRGPRTAVNGNLIAAGGAVALISLVEFREGDDLALETLIPIVFAAIIGSISFWGSNVAFSKLQELGWAKRRFPRLTAPNIALAPAPLAIRVI